MVFNVGRHPVNCYQKLDNDVNFFQIPDRNLDSPSDLIKIWISIWHMRFLVTWKILIFIKLDKIVNFYQKFHTNLHFYQTLCICAFVSYFSEYVNFCHRLGKNIDFYQEFGRNGSEFLLGIIKMYISVNNNENFYRKVNFHRRPNRKQNFYQKLDLENRFSSETIKIWISIRDFQFGKSWISIRLYKMWILIRIR